MKKFLYMLLLLSAPISASDKELEEAREAAPKHITDHAGYMVWGGNKFVLKHKGTNGFICLVLRDSMGRYEPTCLNPPAMKSIFPVYEYQTQMLQSGMSIEVIYKNIEDKFRANEFSAPEPGTLVYMMSHRNKYYDHFSDRLVNVPPHIMIYTPKLNPEQLGFNGKNGLPGYYDEYPHLGVIHVNVSGE